VAVSAMGALDEAVIFAKDACRTLFLFRRHYEIARECSDGYGGALRVAYRFSISFWKLLRQNPGSVTESLSSLKQRFEMNKRRTRAALRGEWP
jgi:hypothetical protein